MSKLKEVFCIFVATVAFVNTANILVLEELSSGSHHLWLRNLIHGLAAAGHNVTSLSDTVYTNQPNGVHYIHLEKVKYHCYGPKEDMFDFFNLGESGPVQQLLDFYDFFEKQCTGAVLSNGWRQLMDYPDDFKFDLVIHDYGGGFCYLAFLEKFNYPPLITASASCDVAIAAASQNAVAIPSISNYFITKNVQITLADRARNYIYFVMDYYFRDLIAFPKLDAVLNDRTNLTIPPLKDLYQRSELMLLNLDPVVTGVEQHPPNFISVGGLQINPPRALNSHLQNIVESSHRGVVLFSLGTNVPLHTVGAVKLNEIFEAFRRLPEFTFLCKFDVNKLKIDVPTNVKLEMWLPQNDILAHPKTVLFMTHNGLLSTQESIWYGVPMLGMPVFVDQHNNAAQTTAKGIGETLHWDDLNTETLYAKLVQILNNPKYKETIGDYSAVFRDQKESPLDRAVWWTEWVIRNPKRAHIRRSSDTLNYIQRHSIDVLAILTVFAFFVTVLMVLLVWIVVRFACNCLGFAQKKKRD